jgi:hypothetical protein
MVPRRLCGKLPPDPDPFEPGQDGVKSLRLSDLFPDQAPLVFAHWVTERLVVPTGPRLVYVHHGFGSLHATYRTIDVADGRVRSIRDWDGREWAQENGRIWPDDEWYSNHPRALVWPEQNAESDEDAPDDEVIDWRTEDDPNSRWLGYEQAQTNALRKPCGQIPRE